MDTISCLIDQVLTHVMHEDPHRCPLTRDLFETEIDIEIPELGESGDGLEERLASYIENLKNLDRDSFVSVMNAILNHSDSIKVLKATTELGKGKLDPNVLKNIILFSPFWVRSYSHDAHSNQQSVIDNLFTNYDVPKFLYNEWEKPTEAINYKWIAWFILLAQGGSIKKSESLFNWSFSTTMQPYLWKVPAHYAGKEAVLYAWILSKNGTYQAAEKILNYPFISHEIDPSEVNERYHFCAYWNRFMRWFLPKADSLSSDKIDMLLESAKLIYNGELYISGKTFKWKGMSRQKVLQAYKDKVMKAKIENGSVEWPISLPQWKIRTSDGFLWEITEITNSEDLIKEGFIMKHCVSEKVMDYVKGNKAVFSLTVNGERTLTVELCLKKLDVSEIGGLTNRPPSVKERVIIHKWIEDSFVKNIPLENILALN